MSLVHVPTIEELHNVLVSEAEVYRQLVALTQRERVALQEKCLASLSTALRAKEVLLEDVGRWQRTRELIVERLAQEWHLPAGTSLSDLVARFDDTRPQVRRIIALRQEFIELVEQLLELNHGNRLLIHAELARLEATFDFLVQATVPDDEPYTAPDSSPVRRPPAAGGNVLNWQV